MSRDQIADRLARGVREARKSSQPPSPAKSTPTRSAPRKAAGKQPAVSQPARSEKSSSSTPTPTLDRPWDNLHPARIWPD